MSRHHLKSIFESMPVNLKKVPFEHMFFENSQLSKYVSTYIEENKSKLKPRQRKLNTESVGINTDNFVENYDQCIQTELETKDQFIQHDKFVKEQTIQTTIDTNEQWIQTDVPSHPIDPILPIDSVVLEPVAVESKEIEPESIPETPVKKPTRKGRPKAQKVKESLESKKKRESLVSVEVPKSKKRKIEDKKPTFSKRSVFPRKKLLK